MNINQSTQSPNFQAKFFYSKSLENVARFAVRANAFEKLNRMQRHISSKHLKTRLRVDINMTEAGLPQVTFTRFYPKYNIGIPKQMSDYKQVKKVTYTSEKANNPLWFAMQKIIEMGSKSLTNDVFNEVVLKK